MLPNFHYDYHKALQILLNKSAGCEPSPNRTAIRSWRTIGLTLRHDMQEGFPLLWSKKIDMRNVAEELFWFLRGSTDEQELRDLGVNIWKEWRRGEDGDLGPIYGYQWRHAGMGFHTDRPWGEDQVANVYRIMRDDPNSRRAVVSCWSPTELGDMALAPCHYSWQLLRCDDRLHIVVTMRSGDMFLGVPYNMASYALLLLIYAKALRVEPGTITLNIADAHLYENAHNAALQQFEFWRLRTILDDSLWPAPQVTLKGEPEFYQLALLSPGEARFLQWHESKFELAQYVPGPRLKVAPAV